MKLYLIPYYPPAFATLEGVLLNVDRHTGAGVGNRHPASLIDGVY